MLGPKQEAQGALFYEFSIDDHIPQDHLLRSVDWFVDLSGIRQHLTSHTGRPLIGPELLIYHPAVHVDMHERAHAVGGILPRHPIWTASVLRGSPEPCLLVVLPTGSERQCSQPRNFFQKLPSHGLQANHCRAVHGHFCDSDVLRHLFETAVARCMAEGLVSGQRFAADASLIAADANKQTSCVPISCT
jgi:hypothetical protein